MWATITLIESDHALELFNIRSNWRIDAMRYGLCHELNASIKWTTSGDLKHVTDSIEWTMSEN